VYYRNLETNKAAKLGHDLAQKMDAKERMVKVAAKAHAIRKAKKGA
jgi:hypothetical protein